MSGNVADDWRWTGARRPAATSRMRSSAPDGKEPTYPDDEYGDRLRSMHRNRGSEMGSQAAEVSG